MTTAQAAAFSTSQVTALATAQIQALNTAAYAALDTSTPIILDLNGDGVRTLSIASGVKFDIFADGKSINTGWVSSGDGLLVLDRNKDGVINDGAELFGSATVLESGQRAPDGYAALRELDSSGDGVISSNDEAFADLRVWVDSNSDGSSGTGEMFSLDSLGISKINLNTSIGSSTDQGNLLGLTSTYETTDGKTHAAADVWFAVDKDGVNATAGTLDAAIAALNAGTSSSTSGPSTLIDMEVAGFTSGPTQAASSPVEIKDDLRTRVGSLAQAIGTFGEDASSHFDLLAGPRPETLSSGLPTTPPVTLAVGNLADAMRQFDAGESLGVKPLTAAAPSTKSLSLPGLQDPAALSMLAAGGKA